MLDAAIVERFPSRCGATVANPCWCPGKWLWFLRGELVCVNQLEVLTIFAKPFALCVGLILATNISRDLLSTTS
eukprot:m.174180 g.174180  ORF g.174180 m.174180 type:complete len:74 (+) comp31756_c0_seq2:1808-2029(+)